jgi:DNA-directed RNA polymerase specialized sigma24 family protein
MTTEVVNSGEASANLHQKLIEGCKVCDYKAQFKVYRLYYKTMYCTSLRIVNNTMDAEEIMRESFISAFEKIDTYPGTVSFSEWLKKIVLNQSLEMLNKKCI